MRALPWAGRAHDDGGDPGPDEAAAGAAREDPAARGCQLSILMHYQGRRVFDGLTRKGMIADWREPNVIRIAPVPLYNTFEDVYQFAHIFKNALPDK